MEVDQDTSSRKRIYSQSNQRNVQNKCLSTRLKVSNSDKPNKYAAPGLKKTLHDNIYQLKLLMLFLKRGLDKEYSFRLATKINEAGKIDDLIFEYKNERKNGIVYRFLQAKHKKDESKKITANDLLTEKDEGFSLQKYFIFYRKIKQNLVFNGQNDKLKDFVICTNIDLDDNLRNSFEEVEDEDNILDIKVQSNSKEPKRLKLMKSDSFKVTLEQKLFSIFQKKRELEIKKLKIYPKLEEIPEITEKREQSFSKTPDPTQTLAEKMVDLINKNNTNKIVYFKRQAFNSKKDIDKLAGHVFIKTEKNIKKFRQGFLDDDILPGNLNNFRERLKTELSGTNKGIQFSQLDQYQFQIKINTCTEEDYEKYKKDKFYFEHHLPNDEVSMEEIDEFLEKLVFAVNQPNEVDLGIIIKDEIGKEFNNIDEENVYSRFLEKMLDWMKEKEGRYISYKDGKDFFEKVKKEIFEEIWFNVMDPVKFFTGRSEKLKELHDALQSGERQVVICGLGGIGKSQLAKKYIYEYREEYDNNVIWINAEKYETIVNIFLKLARDNRVGIRTKYIDGKEKSIRDIVEEIYKLFARRKSLFIFDNAEKYKTQRKEDNGIDKFLPWSFCVNKPNFIITSRNQKWKSSVKKVILLDTFTETESIDFIKKSLNITNDLQDEKIKELAEILQHFPLALQQAVAYIEEKDVALKNIGSKFDINDYLKRYDKETKKLLDFKFPDDSSDPYTKTTFTTWKITINMIKENNKYGKQAEEILDIIAYFAPDRIPVQMFRGLKLIGSNKKKLREAVKLLKQYSMVCPGQKQTVLNVYRLVQQVTKINLKDQNRNVETLRKTLELVEKNIKKKSLPHAWLSMRSILFSFLLNHAISAWGYASEYDELVKEFSNLPRRICKLLDVGLEAHLLEDTMLNPLQKVLGDNHLEVAIMQRYVGNAYGDLDEFGKKEECLKQALCIFIEHLDVAKKQNAENLDNYQKEKKFFKQALSVFEMDFELVKVQNAKNLDDKRQKIWIRMLEIEVAKVKEELGYTYGRLGNQKLDNERDQNYRKRYYKARIESLQEALFILKKIYGLNNFKIAKVLRNLNDAYRDLGNLVSDDQKLSYYKKRIELLEEALSIFTFNQE